MSDQSQADTSCCNAIYNVMTARAAETHRSACPAAATQRLRFPWDHNEQVAVLRAGGKSLAQGKRVRDPGNWGGCLSPDSLLPADGWVEAPLHPSPGEAGGQFATGHLF